MMISKIASIISLEKVHIDESGFLDSVGDTFFDDWTESNIEDEICSSRFQDTKWLMSDENNIYLNSKKAFLLVSRLVQEYSGIFVEIAAGPTGGFSSGYLVRNPNSQVIVSDISRTLMKKWSSILQESGFSNSGAMAMNICNLPFLSETIDVVSGRYALINIAKESGSYEDGMEEAYRVLKNDGCMVLCEFRLSEKSIQYLTLEQREMILREHPAVFKDIVKECSKLGFKQIEKHILGSWNNADDDSDLAALCRGLGVSLDFEEVLLFCYK